MISILIEMAPSALLQSLILSILTIGIMIPFRLLKFADLSCEGSYPFGAALCASLVVSGMHPLLALVIAAFCGGLIGICTAFIHIKYKVNTLLAGIILSTMVYSVNLRIMGKPNLALFEMPTLLTDLTYGIEEQIGIVMVLNIVVLILLYFALSTEVGLRFRAVGLNPKFAEKQGVNPVKNIVFGLFLGNALCALAGAMLVQIQSYADIGMGVGVVIHALAALMIGEKINGNSTLLRQIIAPFIGALVYQQIQGIALAAGLAPSDLKFLTGAIVLIIIAIR